MGELLVLEASEAACQDIADRLAGGRTAWVFHDGRLDQYLREAPRGSVARTGAVRPDALLHDLVRLGGGIRPVQERVGALEVPLADPGLIVVAPGDELLEAAVPGQGVADVLRFLARVRDVIVVLDHVE